MEPIPVTVLTGFLGSGKTTLLNHILTESHGHRIGVLVNEFGEISIDGRLIASHDDNVLELANGCVCCTVRDDLLRSVATLLERPQPPEHIVIETSGLADPVPVAAQLLDPRVQDDIRLDSIITLVDALNFDRNLDYAEQAYSQITTGDILLINKIDLVPDQVAEAIEAGVRRLNPSARLLRCAHARVDIGLILGLRLFKPAALAVKNGHEVAAHDADRHERTRSGGHEHTHTDGHEPDAFRALSIRRPASVNLTRLAGVLDAVPAGIFRGKGVLCVAGAATRLIVHLVGGRWTVTAGDAWRPDEARLTEMVFIGKGLSPAEWAAVEGKINASFED